MGEHEKSARDQRVDDLEKRVDVQDDRLDELEHPQLRVSDIVRVRTFGSFGQAKNVQVGIVTHMHTVKRVNVTVIPDGAEPFVLQDLPHGDVTDEQGPQCWAFR